MVPLVCAATCSVTNDKRSAQGIKARPANAKHVDSGSAPVAEPARARGPAMRNHVRRLAKMSSADCLISRYHDTGRGRAWVAAAVVAVARGAPPAAEGVPPAAVDIGITDMGGLDGDEPDISCSGAGRRDGVLGAACALLSPFSTAGGGVIFFRFVASTDFIYGRLSTVWPQDTGTDQLPSRLVANKEMIGVGVYVLLLY